MCATDRCFSAKLPSYDGFVFCSYPEVGHCSRRPLRCSSGDVLYLYHVLFLSGLEQQLSSLGQSYLVCSLRLSEIILLFYTLQIIHLQ
jgi:hypothetical protein